MAAMKTIVAITISVALFAGPAAAEIATNRVTANGIQFNKLAVNALTTNRITGNSIRLYALAENVARAESIGSPELIGADLPD
jgi:hypothetical protein